MTKKQSKANKKYNSVFEKSVKPYYHKSKDCFIYYSSNKVLSQQSQFSSLTAEEIKNKFGFEFLCNDLFKSVSEARRFNYKKNLSVHLPPEVESYGTETNTMDLFILHKISSKIGFGISTYSALKQGSIIAEYVGERKDANIKIEDASYLVLNNDGTNIDAKNYGNAARFFHHCPRKHAKKEVMTANLAIVPWKASETLTKIFFFAIRDIKAFEPLCWDYGPIFSFEQDVELLNSQTYKPIDFYNEEL
jgi:hypothetical protein